VIKGGVVEGGTTEAGVVQGRHDQERRGRGWCDQGRCDREHEGPVRTNLPGITGPLLQAHYVVPLPHARQQGRRASEQAKALHGDHCDSSETIGPCGRQISTQ
jgi:hypothetical protein